MRKSIIITFLILPFSAIKSQLIIKWAKNITPGYSDSYTVDAVASTSDNYVYVAGKDVGGSTKHYISKFDSSGALLWKKALTDSILGLVNIAVDHNKEVVLIGWIWGKTRLIKLDTAGNKLWLTTIDGFIDGSGSIAVDNNNNIYFPAESTGDSVGDSDFIKKIDPSGAFIENSPPFFYCHEMDVKVNEIGEIFVTGRYDPSVRNLIFGRIGSRLLLQAEPSWFYGNFLVKFSPTFNIDWIKTSAATSSFYKNSLCFGSNGDIYTAWVEKQKGIWPFNPTVKRFGKDSALIDSAVHPIEFSSPTMKIAQINNSILLVKNAYPTDKVDDTIVIYQYDRSLKLIDSLTAISDDINYTGITFTEKEMYIGGVFNDTAGMATFDSIKVLSNNPTHPLYNTLFISRVTTISRVSLVIKGSTSRYVAPATINLKAVINKSNSSISKVEFYNGTHLLHIERKAPYGFVWRDVPVGNYTLTAKATANSGNVTTSDAVHISVVPNKPPTVSILAPANNEHYAAPAYIHFEAAASDSDGRITRVEFYNGSTLLRTEYKYPYTYVWKNVPVGTYTITAVATDNWGAQTTSAPVTVKVKCSNGRNALQFDGVGSYVNAGAKSSLEVDTAITVEAWIYPRGEGSIDGGIIVNREGEYEMARRGGQISIAIANTSPGWDWINTGYEAPSNKWTYVSFTYSASEGIFKFYGNGVEEYSTLANGNIGDISISSDSDQLWIGARQYFIDPVIQHQNFDGVIDEVRVWNKALSKSTIQFWMNKPVTSSHPDFSYLKGYWKLDEGKGATTSDASGYGNTGTLINSPTWTKSSAPIACDQQLIADSRPNNKTSLNPLTGITLYPNPATSILNIYTKGLQQRKPAEISIISALGLMMKTMHVNEFSESIQLNVSSLPKGVYTIKIIIVNNTIFKQFVKL